MLLIVSDNLIQNSWRIGSLAVFGSMVSKLKRMWWSRVLANFNNLQLLRDSLGFPNIAKRFCMGLESAEISDIKDFMALHSNVFQSLRNGGMVSIAYFNGILFVH